MVNATQDNWGKLTQNTQLMQQTNSTIKQTVLLKPQEICIQAFKFQPPLSNILFGIHMILHNILWNDTIYHTIFDSEILWLMLSAKFAQE